MKCIYKIFFLSLFLIPHFLKATPTVPDTVKIGSYVINVHDVNFHDKEYTMRFWLWMLYDDSTDFDFEKQIDVPNAKTIEQPTVITDTINDKVWQLMKMKCTMNQSWKVGEFPFDKQHLSVQIENSLYDNRFMVFAADTAGSKYDEELALDGWEVTSFKVSTGDNDYKTAFGDPRTKDQFSEYASFRIDIDIERDALGLFMKIFIGMYISFLIAMVSFIIDPLELEPRYGLPVGGLFAAVGNKYIIDSILPESTSFTLVDSLHTATFLCIFFNITVSAVALVMHEKGKEHLVKKVNKWGAIFVISLYLLINIILIGAAIMKR